MQEDFGVLNFNRARATHLVFPRIPAQGRGAVRLYFHRLVGFARRQVVSMRPC